jgi:peptidoglycan/LPS O-acetylase OafA/YrhL
MTSLLPAPLRSRSSRSPAEHSHGTSAADRGATLFLDGLRGLAALAIVGYHAFLFTGLENQTTQGLPAAAHVFLLGQLAVAMFIVLSGFVLSAPAIRRGGVLPRGTTDYLRRRARRILPPYYAAIGVSLALIAAFPVLQHRAGTAWDSKIPVTPAGILSHVLLIQDVMPQWIFQADGPLWSIAVEWQLYFFLPFALLPLRRRWGTVPTVLTAGLAGPLLAIAVPGSQIAHPWLLGCFALGMLAADMVYGGADFRFHPLLTRCARPAVLVPATVASVAAFAAVAPKLSNALVIADTVTAALVAAWIVAVATGASPLVRRVKRILESRALLTVGMFSYSIYLVHAPVLALLNLESLHWRLPLAGRLALMVAVAAPLAVGVGYLFHRLVEKRFLTSHQRSVSTADATPR